MITLYQRDYEEQRDFPLFRPNMYAVQKIQVTIVQASRLKRVHSVD